MEGITIRPASEQDCGRILALIRELAAYEHMEQEVTATEDTLWASIFQRHMAGVFVAEADKQVISDGQGETVGLIYTDVGRRKFSASFIPLAGASDSPVEASELVGEALEFTRPGGTKIVIRIDSAVLRSRKGGLPEFAVEGYRYPGVENVQS